jgi:hypothetical protein
MSAEQLLVYVLGFGVLGFLVMMVFGVYGRWLRWAWKQRGRGLAEGWYQVTEQRARPDSVTAVSVQPGTVGGWKPEPHTTGAPAKVDPPTAPATRPASGPVRYLVPKDR